MLIPILASLARIAILDPSRLYPEQRNSLSSGSLAQLPIQRGERDFPSRGNLQIGGAIYRETMTLDPLQSATPNLTIGLRINRQRKQRQSGQCAIAELRVVPS